MQLADYVLSQLSAQDKQQLNAAFEDVAQALAEFVGGQDFQAVMRNHNIRLTKNI